MVDHHRTRNGQANQFEQQVNQGMPASGAAPQAPAGSSSGEVTVVYEIVGDGTATSVTYTSDGMMSMEQKQGVELPFRTEIAVESASFNVFSISAQNSGSGKLTCRITVDGQVIKEATSTGKYSVVMCNGTGQ